MVAVIVSSLRLYRAGVERLPRGLLPLRGRGLVVLTIKTQVRIAEGRADEAAVVGLVAAWIAVGGEVGAGQAHTGQRYAPFQLQGAHHLDHGPEQDSLLVFRERLDGGQEEVGPGRQLLGGTGAGGREGDGAGAGVVGGGALRDQGL